MGLGYRTGRYGVSPLGGGADKPGMFCVASLFMFRVLLGGLGAGGGAPPLNNQSLGIKSFFVVRRFLCMILYQREITLIRPKYIKDA